LSLGRKKLEALGVDLPTLPITAVGSYAKPDDLKRARTQFGRGDIDRQELRSREEEATAMWMGFQNEIGVDVPVDGEMYRGDMVAYFAEEMDGFERGGLVRSYGNRFYRKPIITGEVRWRGPMTVDWWKFAQSLTERPVKGMLTGGYTVMDWSFNEFYPDRNAAALAFARELRKEVEALVEAGCKIIQVDEPAISVRADEIEVAIEATQITCEGIDAYFVTHALEYGYPQTVFPGVLRLAVDNFDMEFANSDFTFLEKLTGFGFDKDLSLGVLDVHTHITEPTDVIAGRIRRAAEILPVDTLWIDPDCGLKTRTVEEAMEKMRVIANATKTVRASLAHATPGHGAGAEATPQQSGDASG
jgi:5-methyltetrahydropteroyltriglutamate--homocysteine methyltransferase